MSPVSTLTAILRKHLFLAVVLFLTLIAIGGVFVQEIRAETQSILLFGKEDATVLYSTESPSSVRSVASLNFGFFTTSKFLQEHKNVRDQKIFLSPDRKYLAVTIQEGDGLTVSTYIANLNGDIVVSKRPGSFSSWSPDSKEVLLYLAIEATGTERQIYSLGLNGEYRNLGLPPGVIGADISPTDGSVVYALTDSRTDNADLYIRKDGKDQRILSGQGHILAWPRWSPNGTSIAFLKSDSAGHPDNQTLWLINPSEEGSASEISHVQWNYPPIWSPDGVGVVFANNGNIWELDTQQDELTNLTSGQTTDAKQPSYSSDGNTILFSDGEQIWSIRGGDVLKITNDSNVKGYPILP